MRWAVRVLAALVLCVGGLELVRQLTDEPEPAGPEPDLSSTVESVDPIWGGEVWTVDPAVTDPFVSLDGRPSAVSD